MGAGAGPVEPPGAGAALTWRSGPALTWISGGGAGRGRGLAWAGRGARRRQGPAARGRAAALPVGSPGCRERAGRAGHVLGGGPAQRSAGRAGGPGPSRGRVGTEPQVRRAALRPRRPGLPAPAPARRRGRAGSGQGAGERSPVGRTKARGWGLPAHLARSVFAPAEAAQVCVRPGGTAGRASTRPGEGGAGPGAGVPAQAPAGPWPPPASADSGEGVAPSPCGPGAPAWPPPGLVSPPAVPPSVFLHLPLSSFPFAAAASPLSRPPFSLRFPAARRRSLPLPAPAPGRLHLLPSPPGGWPFWGDKFGVFSILPPSNDGQPSPEPAAGSLGASTTPGLGLFEMGWQQQGRPGSATAA